MLKKNVIFFLIAALLLGTIAIPCNTSRAEASSLQQVGSYDNLKKLLAEAASRAPQIDYLMEDSMIKQTAMPEAGAPANTPASNGDYSRTNTQVAGVDEGDNVKTDGQYIYIARDNDVIICQATPKLRQIAKISYSNTGFSPREIYVDKDYLVVIGESYSSGPVIYNNKMNSLQSIMPPRNFQSTTTQTIVYSLNNKSNPEKLRETEIDGYYMTSRKTGNNLYILSNKNINYYYDMEKQTESIPVYRDSKSGTSFHQLSFDKIYYCPNFVQPEYLVVEAINLSNEKEADITAYLGSGDSVYASSENLYAATSIYEYPAVMKNGAYPDYTEYETQILKFALKNGKAEFLTDGKVPGSVLNQFSMDEYNGAFRIATTTGDAWRTDGHTSKNNLYVLDKNLSITGKLTDLAPGEKIYSVRFMGKKAYIVTFRTVDPLFVIDLSKPENPTVLGALKIPGYSDYLHPYDENHVIGFGKDTVEQTNYDYQGNSAGTSAYYLGMKMALFDVSDPTHPKQQFTASIGDRGTDSELLQNHKALLFSRQKNLLAFPVTVMKTDANSTDYRGMPAYGSFEFQGAYVYNIDTENGFILKGRISHLTREEMQKSGQYWYDDAKNINRIIYIGNNLYTLSNGMVKSFQIDDLKETGSITIQ